MTQREVAKRLKSLRKQHGYTQEFIANTLGIARTSYINLESGKRSLSLTELQELSRLYRMPMSELLDDIDNQYKKYQQMLIYLLKLHDEHSDGKVPKTKLAKMLYLADFAKFYQQHKSMSGLEYRKRAYGPVSDYYFTMLEELVTSGKIHIEQSKNGKAFLIKKTRTGSLVGDDLLTQDDKEILENIVTRWYDTPTEEIVNFTHQQLPYQFTQDNKLIPYELITQEEPDNVY